MESGLKCVKPVRPLLESGLECVKLIHVHLMCASVQASAAAEWAKPSRSAAAMTSVWPQRRVRHTSDIRYIYYILSGLTLISYLVGDVEKTLS